MKSTIESVRDTSSAPSGVDPIQWSANPYANYDYRHSWWQKLIEGVGLRSKWDAYRENMAMNSAEYQAQLAEKAHNEEYDSPAEQNARLRAAGINPDLAGETSSGSSSPMEPDPNAPIVSEPDDPMGAIQNFTNMALGAFTGAIGFSEKIVGLIGNVEDIASKRSGNRNSIIQEAIDWTFRNIPEYYNANDEKGNSESLDGWNRDLVVDNAEDYAESTFFRPRDRKLFRSTVRDWVHSAPGNAEAYKAWYEQGSARTSWNGMYGSGLFSMTDRVMRDLLDPIIKSTDDIRKKEPVVRNEQLDAEGAQAAYNEAYYGSLDGTQAANAENASNKAAEKAHDIDEILNGAMDDILRNLKNTSRHGKGFERILASGLILFLSAMRTYHPKISASNSSGSTPWGPTSHSSASFGF